MAENPTGRARVNRDDLRAMCHESVFLGQDTERQIQSVRDAAIRSLLKRGVSVVCDDTNLPQRVARDLAKIATLAGAEVTVLDMTDVPFDVCVERDAARERSVGRDVIEGMRSRYLGGKPYPLPLPEELPEDTDEVAPYVAREGTPLAVMIDVDGTIALMGTRSPFDETRVHEDAPNWPVIEAVSAMIDAGYYPLFCSGRTAVCRSATEEWIERYLPDLDATASYGLYMRSEGDTRKDSIVKRELFDTHIRDRYNVRCVFDDRTQVVQAWRELGLPCFQVAPGDF